MALELDIEAIRAGNKAAFERAYHSLKGPIYTLALRTLGSRTAAEDVTQETFLRLYTVPPGPEVRNPRAWLFRVARNLAIDELRKRREETMEENYPVPERDLSLGMDIESALAALPDEERQIVTLHLNAEFSFAELASVMGLSLPAVYRRYQKAVRTLRETLKGDAI